MVNQGLLTLEDMKVLRRQDEFVSLFVLRCWSTFHGRGKPASSSWRRSLRRYQECARKGLGTREDSEGGLHFIGL